MKKILSMGLALALTLSVLAGCTNNGGSTGENSKTPEQLNELYTTAITENGGEMAEYNAPFNGTTEEGPMMLEVMGLTAEDVTAYAISTSMMMVHAYGIVAAMPAEGKEEAVIAGLQSFIEQKQQAFEMYLPDQYENAKNAKLETLADGTVLMVMTADQDTVFEAIKAAIEA